MGLLYEDEKVMGFHVSQEEMKERICSELVRRVRDGGEICSMLRLEYVSSDVEKAELTLKHIVQQSAANPSGKLHGGIITWLMDSTMGMLSRGYTGIGSSVTADIHVNFLKGIDVGNELFIKARITHAGRTIINICSEATVNGKLCATADAIFYKIS